MVLARVARFSTVVIVVQLALSALCFGAEKQLHHYLLSKPLNYDVEIGKYAHIVHPILVAGMGIGYTAALYSRTQEPLAILSFISYEVAKFPAMLLRNSIIELSARQAIARWKKLRSISKIPGISRFSMLTASYIEREGTYFQRQRNSGYVFVESEEPLKADGDWIEEFGAPIEVTNLEETKLSLRLKLGEFEHEVAWETTLKDILEKKAMPEEVGKAWADYVDKLGEGRSRRERFSKKYEEGLEVVTKITLPNGTSKEIGTLLQGKSVRKLLGMTLTRRAWSFLKAGFRRTPLGADPQPLPICERVLQGD
ncbi:MAG: hypothetical protein HY075_04795 [Deltaproteobacteria bacterium]|nr:hypothetical protein [Deltaproteobacteria bacterium]